METPIEKRAREMVEKSQACEAITNLGFEKKAAQQMMTRIAPALSGVLTIMARDDICLISKPLAILVNTHVGQSTTLLEARISNRLVEVC